jgi:hypothetical protein
LTKTTGRLGGDAPLARLNTLGLALPESAAGVRHDRRPGRQMRAARRCTTSAGVSGAAPVWETIASDLRARAPSRAPTFPAAGGVWRVAFEAKREPECDVWRVDGRAL